MGDFTYAEKGDMHYMYGRANANGRATLRIYCVQFPDRRMQDHRIFQRLHRQLSETVLFNLAIHEASRPRSVHNPSLKGRILNIMADRTESSTRAVVHLVGVCL